MLSYRFVLALAAPLLATLALWRWLRGREDRAALRDRLFGAATTGPRLWVHGASNGELASAKPLIEALLAADPGRSLLVTANTVTGRDLVASWELDRVAAHVAPLDLRSTTGHVLDHCGVTGLLLLENEFWPNRMALCHARSLPVLMIAARMSDRSARLWESRPALSRDLLGPVTLAAPQDGQSEARLVRLGLRNEALAPRIDLKSLYRPAGKEPDAALAAAFPHDRTLLAASTHEGEEAIALAAFRQALAQRSDLRLMLAPRHPARAAAIRAEAERLGLTVAQRSEGETPEAQVYLADTMGELELWYRLAGAALIGGSLVDKGGHTPYEPAALGCAILHGESTTNFAATYERLDEGGGAVCINGAEGLAAAWLEHVEGSPLPDRAAELLAPDDLPALMSRVEAVLAQAKA